MRYERGTPGARTESLLYEREVAIPVAATGRRCHDRDTRLIEYTLSAAESFPDEPRAPPTQSWVWSSCGVAKKRAFYSQL
jgi:hypothetical protein